MPYVILLTNQQEFLFDQYNTTLAIKKYTKIDWLPIAFGSRMTNNF